MAFLLAVSRVAPPADGFDDLLPLLEATEPDLTALRSPLTVLLSPPWPNTWPHSSNSFCCVGKCHQVGDRIVLLHGVPMKRQRFRDHEKGKGKVDTSDVNNGCFWSLEYGWIFSFVLFCIFQNFFTMNMYCFCNQRKGQCMVIFKKPLLGCMPTWACGFCGFHTENCRSLSPLNSSEIQGQSCPKSPDQSRGVQNSPWPQTSPEWMARLGMERDKDMQWAFLETWGSPSCHPQFSRRSSTPKGRKCLC